MTEPFLGEVHLMAFNFPPKGWASCNGALLPINQNQALFALLGTMYGGNGQTNFALPNLQGRVPIHVGAGHVQGESSGDASVTLNQQQIPHHTHLLFATEANADTPIPTGARPGTVDSSTVGNVYSTEQAGAAMASNALSEAGGGQAHQNMQPYLALNFCIALQGVFPSRN
jgi:microcystin-dependent protein